MSLAVKRTAASRSLLLVHIDCPDSANVQALAFLRLQLQQAPAEYRADTVRNIDAWYSSFDVKAGETLYLAPDQRVRIW